MRKETDRKNQKRKRVSTKKAGGYKRSSNVEFLKEHSEKRNKKVKYKTNFYYSLLTIVLLVFLFQVAFSAILNISKNISYSTKINTIKKSKAEAEEKNKQLRAELQNFSTSETLEAIARNNLKMAGDDEVLIIINEIKKQNDENLQEKKKKGIFNLGKYGK